MQGYLLGKRALDEGLGVLDMALLHHDSLAEICSATGQRYAGRAVIEQASLFFCEALASFELTHQAFRDLTQVIHRVICFATEACHELRAPLTAILASAGMLEELRGPNPYPDAERLLSSVLSSARTLQAQVQDLSDVVGFYSGALSITQREVDLSCLVREVCARLELVVSRAGMELHVDAPNDLPTIQADPLRLEQVIVNLVYNAMKHARGSPSIDVRCRSTEGLLVLDVEDHGPGIPLRDQVRLFQPYFRGDAEARGVPGLGVGLALCKQIVEAHRGLILVESREGKGTLFRIALTLDPGQTQ